MLQKIISNEYLENRAGILEETYRNIGTLFDVDVPHSEFHKGPIWIGENLKILRAQKYQLNKYISIIYLWDE